MARLLNNYVSHGGRILVVLGFNVIPGQPYPRSSRGSHG